jgi:N-acetylglutamate synthase-like GNAT family acetyltransferase
MENVRIKVYSEEYQESVIELILGIQRGEFGVPITLEQQPDLNDIGNFYQRGNGNFWIALHGDLVVGTIALIDIGHAQLALRKMFVLESFRGKEYRTSQLLLDAALKWMKDKNCREVILGTLDIFKAAQKFYLKNGFEEITKDQLPANFPRMTLDNRFFKKRIRLPHPVEILQYQENHQPWFEKFNRAWIEHHFWMEPIDIQVLQNPQEHIIKQGGKILMAASEKEIAGTVALKYVEPGVYEFTKMAVDEKFRGKKIGEALALAAIHEAELIGAKKIILYSNRILTPAIELYKKMGFREVPVDAVYKRSDIKMELILKSLMTN